MHLEDLLLPANDEEDAPRGPRQERPSKRKRRAEQKHVLSEWHTRALHALFSCVAPQGHEPHGDDAAR
jgi:hypothetical protein